MYKLGINFNNQCGQNTQEVLKNIKDAGFDSVMLAFNLKNDEEQIIEALNLNLDIPYVHLAYNFGNDLWVKGKSADEYVENVIKQLELCAKYKINIAVFHCTWGSPSDIANKPNKNGLDNFKKIFSTAKKLGISIALENLDKMSIKHLKFLFKHIKSDKLGFCYDSGHHNLYCPKIDLLRKFGSNLLAIHLHDNYGGWEKYSDFTKDCHILPFDGIIDFDNICKKLAKTNYNNAIMLEVHKSSFSTPKIYENLNNLDYLKEAKNRVAIIAKKIEEQRKI